MELTVGLRETLNQKPAIGYSVAGGLVLLGILAIVLYFRSGAPTAPTSAGKQFYSDDDGQTYFTADATLVPPAPSPRDPSKMAVRAAVYQCGSGKPFVAYLQKYDEKTRAIVATAGPAATTTPMEVKKPKAKNWVARNGPQGREFAKITAPECPGGEVPTPVDPNQ